MANRGGMAALVLIGMTLSAGCGISTSATFLRPPPRTLLPRSGDSVEVFGAGPPSRPHIDLALIEAEQESSNTFGDTPELIAQLRQKAGELGCDALVLTDLYARVDSLSTLVTGNTYDRKGISGTCIVYTEAAVAAESATVSNAAAAHEWREPVKAPAEQARAASSN